MPTIFDIAKSKGQVTPIVATLGVNVAPAETWDDTKGAIAKKAKAALRKRGMKPATANRWHLVAYMAAKRDH